MNGIRYLIWRDKELHTHTDSFGYAMQVMQRPSLPALYTFFSPPRHLSRIAWFMTCSWVRCWLGTIHAGKQRLRVLLNRNGLKLFKCKFLIEFFCCYLEKIPGIAYERILVYFVHMTNSFVSPPFESYKMTARFVPVHYNIRTSS